MTNEQRALLSALVVAYNDVHNIEHYCAQYIYDATDDCYIFNYKHEDSRVTVVMIDRKTGIAKRDDEDVKMVDDYLLYRLDMVLHPLYELKYSNHARHSND